MGIIRTDEELERIEKSGALTKEQMEILRISSKPSRWCETYLKHPDADYNDQPIVYDDFQKEFLDSTNPSRSLLCGRGSGKTVTLVSDILWECCTENNVKIFYYLPGLSQLERIYEVMENMISKSEHVSELITINKKTKETLNKKDEIEHVINFKTGSRVIFFVCDQKISKIRSHHGGKVYIDEGAEIKEEAFEAILGVLTNTRNPKLVMAGTPKGKHGTFYHYTEDPGTHKIWQPSWKSRHWTPEKESIARRMCPEENRYLQEYGAMFITDDDQVYPDEDINKCVNLTTSTFGEYTSSKYGIDNGKYLNETQLEQLCLFDYDNLFIGIDWNNPINGVQIVFLTEKKLPNGSDCQVAKIVSISNRKFTQLESVEKIIEIYRQYNPTAIYADAGYGCLPGWFRVETANGRTFLKDLRVGDLVLTAEGRYKPVESIQYVVPRQIWNIELPHGEYLDCSHNHKFLVGLSNKDPEHTDYLLPEQLKAGMRLVINSDIDTRITSSVKIDLTFLMSNFDDIEVKRSSIIYDRKLGLKYDRMFEISKQDFVDLVSLINNYGPPASDGTITIPDNGGPLSSEYRKEVIDRLTNYINKKNTIPGVTIEPNNTGATIRIEGVVAKTLLCSLKTKEHFTPDMMARFIFTGNVFTSANTFSHKKVGDSIRIDGHPVVGRLLLAKGIFISTTLEEDNESIGYIHPEYGKKYFDRFNRLMESHYTFTGKSKRNAVIEVGKLYLCKIESIFRAAFVGERYYDIQIADDRSYVAGGFVHHNSVQTELILKYAQDHNMNELLDRYKTIDFSSNIEIDSVVAYNRVLKKKDKVIVRVKNHMVSLLIDAMKNGTLALPAFEGQKGGLIDELRQFQLKSETVKGEPIYSKKGGQHKHMALALAYYARYVYYKDLNKQPETKAGSITSLKHEILEVKNKSNDRFHGFDLGLGSISLNPYDRNGSSYDRNGDLF